MQPLAAPTRVLRRPTPPAAASTMPTPPPSPSNRTPLLRPPELPLPSALVPPKKRRVFRTPAKATTPLPPPPPPPVVPVAVPAATPPSQAEQAEPPLFSAPKPSPPPPAETPSSPPLPPPPTENPPSPSLPTEKPPSPPPPAEKPSSPPPPVFSDEPSSAPSPPPPTENPFSPPPPPPPAENPSFPSPPPSSDADEKPSVLPPTDAAAEAEPAPAPKPRRITRKVRTIRRRVPKGTIAARKAAAEAASAAAGALQPGKGHAPDFSSRNAAADEVVEEKQSFGENTIEKPVATCKPVAVCETQLGKRAAAVCGTQLGKGELGGGTLTSQPATDIGGDHEVEKKLGSRGEDRSEVVMSERQRRRMTEVFVGGLNRDAKEEDVREALSVAGKITEVRMIMDAAAKKNKGYCFVRYRESAQARKAIAKFSNVKVVLDPHG